MNSLSKQPGFEGWIAHFTKQHAYYKQIHDNLQRPGDIELHDEFKHLNKF